MCGRRHRHHQPLFVKAAVAGSAMACSAYNKNKEKRQERLAGAPDGQNMLEASRDPYENVSATPPYADANAAPMGNREKVAPPGSSRESPEFDPVAPPPSYEDASRAPPVNEEAMYTPPPGPPHATVRPAGNERGFPGYGEPSSSSHQTNIHPATRPEKLRRKSSASSLSSVTSASSVSSDEYEAHTRNFVPGNARPMLQPNMNQKKIAKHGRQHLRRALKHAKSMDEAALTVLGSIGTLFRVDPAHMRTFSTAEGK